MMVCAHGDVTEFCETRGWYICEKWEGEIIKYNGLCPVLVTDADISETEYYYLKGQMLGKRTMLISTRYSDDKLMEGYLIYANSRRKESHHPGRSKFDDTEIIQKIRELSASGMSIRAIRDTEGICHPDGRKLSLSTIHKIINKK